MTFDDLLWGLGWSVLICILVGGLIGISALCVKYWESGLRFKQLCVQWLILLSLLGILGLSLYSKYVEIKQGLYRVTTPIQIIDDSASNSCVCHNSSCSCTLYGGLEGHNK